MTVSPTSNVNAVYQQQQAQNQASSSKAKASSAQQADTVHLSPTAKAQLKGGDVDHDGDSH
jgi:hypothetical protein